MHRIQARLGAIAILCCLGLAPMAAQEPPSPPSPAGPAAEEGEASLHGRVVAAGTLRPIEDARVTVYDAGDREILSRTDSSGDFRVSGLDDGLYTVLVEADGFVTAVEPNARVVRRKSTFLEFSLIEGQAFEAAVTVSAETGRDRREPVTAVQIDRETIRRAAGTAGDVFRGLDTLPGVVSTGEFSNFVVRGRGPRDNLVLVDGIPFDKVVHFDQNLGEQEDIEGGGRFSIFAPNLVGGASFQPGAWRAPWGGKNGSLLRLEIAEGNPDTPSISGRIDLAGLEVNYDGPLARNGATRLLFSARHLDYGRLFDIIDEADIGTPELTDIIAKVSHDVNERHRLEFLGVYAPESFERTLENALESPDFEDRSLVASEQDSALFGLTWRWLAGDSAVVENIFYYRESDKFATQGESFPDLVEEPDVSNTPVREEILTTDEGEREIGWRGDVTWEIDASQRLAVGGRVTLVELDYDVFLDGDWIRYTYDQNDFRPDPEQRFIVLRPETFDSSYDRDATRSAAYGEYSADVGRTTLTAGLRVDHDGFSDQVLWSPRLGLNWDLAPRTRLFAGAGIFYQAPRYFDLALDPSNATLGQERSNQVSVGVARRFGEDWRLTVEGYYQDLEDLIVIPDRTTGAADNSGTGRTYGADVLLEKRLSRTWTGSVNYSRSSSRRDDGLGEGLIPADNERPNVLNLSLAWQPTARWAFAAKWKYASGRPSDAFVIHEDVLGPDGPERFSRESIATNAERLPDFHTLNVRVDYRRRFGRLSLIAFLDVVNVYGRDNVNSLEFDELNGRNITGGLSTFPQLGLKFEF
jgi:outer membrane receptor for ferrienterochelin and colicin